MDKNGFLVLYFHLNISNGDQYFDHYLLFFDFPYMAIMGITITIKMLRCHNPQCKPPSLPTKDNERSEYSQHRETLPDWITPADLIRSTK